MKKIFVMSLLMGSTSMLFAQDCIDCLNNMDSSLPGVFSQISEVAQGVSCAAVVETEVSDDLFAMDAPKKDICECIIDKNLDQIKEESGEAGERLRAAYGRLIQSRYALDGQRWSQITHSLALSGVSSTHLADGGACDIKTQIAKVSCYGSDAFKERLAKVFPVAEEYDFSKKPEEQLADFWRGRAVDVINGKSISAGVTGNRCLDKQTADLLEKQRLRSNDDLVVIGKFLNKEATSPAYDYRLYEQKLRELGTPKRAIEALASDQSVGDKSEAFQRLRIILNLYPRLSGMMAGNGSYARLKVLFSGRTDEWRNPDKFLRRHFESGDNNNLSLVVKNIEQECISFSKSFEKVLCQEISEPDLTDELFVEEFSDKGDGGIDTVEEALVCHARYCKEGNARDELRAYCIEASGEETLEEEFKKIRYDYGAELKSIEDILAGGSEGSTGIQEKICSYLVCEDPVRPKKMCRMDDAANMNRATDILDKYCPDGPVAEAKGVCSKESYNYLHSLRLIQEREIKYGVVKSKEVPDYSMPKNDDGTYPTKTVYERQDGFAEHFWGVTHDQVQMDVSTEKKSGKADHGNSKHPKEKVYAVGNNVPEGREVATFPAVKKPVSASSQSGSRQLQQAQELASAAIDMAQNATKLNERVNDKLDRIEAARETPTKIGSIDGRNPASDSSDSAQDFPEGDGTTSGGVDEGVGGPFESSTKPFGTGKSLSDSVTDMAPVTNRRGGRLGSSSGGSLSGISGSFGLPSGVDSGVLGESFSPRAQKVSLTDAELPEFELTNLKGSGVDPHRPFLMEIEIDGKVYKVEVKPFVYKGKLLHRPELDHLKTQNTKLYQAIRMSPLFKDYIAFESSQKVYEWNDVLQLLSQAESTNNNA